MSNYLRSFVPGGTFFFTVALAQRGDNDLLVREIELLRDSVRATRATHPFEIVAWVVLPDHLHAIWTMPPNDHNYSVRWAAIKSRFSRGIPNHETRSNSRATQGERGIWQRRFWEHTIRDERDLQHHIDYIHYNPVKHALVARAADWPHSTFHRFVAQGLCSRDWASAPSALNND
jgi:putative transposase